MFILQVGCAQISNYLPYSFILKAALFIVILPFAVVSIKLNNIKYATIITKDKIKFKYLVIIFLVFALNLTYSCNKEFGALKLSNFVIGTLPSILILIYIKEIFDDSLILLITPFLLVGSVLLMTVLLFTGSFTYAGSYKILNLEYSHVIASRILSPIILWFNYLISTEENKNTIYKIFFPVLYLNTGLIFIAHRASVTGVILITIYFIFTCKNRLITGCLLISSLVIAFLLFPQKTERHKNLFSAGNKNDYSIESRLDLWETAIEKIREKPLTGYGLGGFKCPADKPFVHIYKYPHNIFLEAGSEMGLTGIILLIFLLYKILISAYRKSKFLFSIALLAFWWSLFSKDISTQTVLWMYAGMIEER
ncbi:O-antigen ligase family protein [Melioribacter roseus]|uniref:O-antigen ligase family protein n=1 Tax=Melioribacter roseus TaxID=1134405 RepID=UPI0012FEEDE7|nr:O-antigen ligase family protein [Melioribacter roseus]